MEYRQLGNTEVKVSALAFGAWAIGGWMWGGADKDEALSAIHQALDLGMTSIDTAPVYGFGVSEEIVGEALEGKQREKIQILTKYGLRWNTKAGQFYFESKKNDGTPVAIHRYAAKESVINECEQSLHRLKTDYIDLYQIHWHDATTPIAETMEAIDILLKQGKIRAAGVCNYTAQLVAEACNTVNICSNQVPYSMVYRNIETELVPYSIENNKSIVVYSPMQRGLLTGKITPDYKFNEGDNRPATPYYKSPNIERINAMLDEMRPIAQNHRATLSQLVLNWTLQRPGITCLLVGARDAKQVEENCKALDFALSNSEIQTIDVLVNNLKLEI